MAKGESFDNPKHFPPSGTLLQAAIFPFMQEMHQIHHYLYDNLNLRLC